MTGYTLGPSAQRALDGAKSEAERLGSEAIGAEHILLRVTADEPAVSVFRAIGLDQNLVRERLELGARKGKPRGAEAGELLLTSHARRLLEVATTEARQRGSELGADVATPAFSDGHFFVLSDATRDDRMVKLVPATGKVVWSTELPGRFKWEASPTVADGKVYCMNFNGDVVVLDATSGKILASNPMGEANADMIRSSIVALDGQLFIRTNGWLYRVGK